MACWKGPRRIVPERMCLALQPCHNAFHRKPEATKPFLSALAHSETFSQGQVTGRGFAFARPTLFCLAAEAEEILRDPGVEAVSHDAIANGVMVVCGDDVEIGRERRSEVKRLREFVGQLELLIECAGTPQTRGKMLR